MPLSNELTQKSTPSILLIGDGGTEKTRFLAQSPAPFIYDFDDGLISTQDLPAFGYQRFKDAPYGSKAYNREHGIYPWGEAWPAWINHLNEQMWPAIESGSMEVSLTGKKGGPGYPFKTIGIDSLTTLTTQCMNYVLKASTKKPTDPITLPEWGTQLRLMETVLEQLAAWPVRLIVTAHIKRDVNDTMGTTEFLPMITGQLSSRIGVYFDEVYYTDVRGKGSDRKVVLLTDSDTLRRQAKSRHRVPSGSPNNWSAIEKYFNPR